VSYLHLDQRRWAKRLLQIGLAFIGHKNIAEYLDKMLEVDGELLQNFID
jgi:hypothetical protein